MRTTKNLFTKSQLEYMFRRWGCTEPVPAKGKKVLIAFAGKGMEETDVVEVSYTDLKGTYNDRLYEVVMSSKAGRDLEAKIQESHVIAYRLHLIDRRIKLNIHKIRNKQCDVACTHS